MLSAAHFSSKMKEKTNLISFPQQFHDENILKESIFNDNSFSFDEYNNKATRSKMFRNGIIILSLFFAFNIWLLVFCVYKNLKTPDFSDDYTLPSSRIPFQSFELQ